MKFPRTKFGFPIEEGARGSSKRGIALIIAVLAVAMIMIFTSDMIINSQVNLEMATAHRDQVKAEYMAKSGFNLANFLLTADWGLDLALASGTLGQKVDPSDGVGDFWAMLNGFPIGGDTLELLGSLQETFKLGDLNDEEIVNSLLLFDGQFVLNVSDENGKINLNDCYVNRCTEVMLMLKALMSCPAEKTFLETKDLDAATLAHRIKDYVDKNKTTDPETGFTSEDDPYQKVSPSYQAKNAPFDSINELRLVEGWDEDIHKVFSPYLTVYPFRESASKGAQVNINTAHRALLGCLFPDAKADCNENFQLGLFDRSDKSSNLAANQKELKDAVKNIMCYNQVSGKDSKDNKLNWFTTRSTVLRVEAEGLVGSQTKKLVAVVERVVPDKAKKLTTSYKILYWRLL